MNRFRPPVTRPVRPVMRFGDVTLGDYDPDGTDDGSDGTVTGVDELAGINSAPATSYTVLPGDGVTTTSQLPVQQSSPSSSSGAADTGSGFSISSLLNAFSTGAKALTSVESTAALATLNQQRLSQGLAPLTSLPGSSILSDISPTTLLLIVAGVMLLSEGGSRR